MKKFEEKYRISSYDFYYKNCDVCDFEGNDNCLWNTYIERVFGTNYVCELDSEPDFATAMQNINEHRTKLAEKADDLAFLSNDQITNVALELELFTRHHVIVL